MKYHLTPAPRIILAASLAALTLSGVNAAPPTPPPAEPQMQAVLDKLAYLGGKPIVDLSPEEARKQPSPADAVKAILKDQDKPTAGPLSPSPGMMLIAI